MSVATEMGDSSAHRRSATVILIPKKLRMEWTDALALDRDLSNMGFRVACVIGTHFNNQSGDTFVSQETIARVMGVSERSVWTALKELEERGYLLIERREFGTVTRTTKSGTQIAVRTAGGRGVANVYKPAFERSQLAATNRGKKLAAHCDLIWKEWSQNPARKVAADCDPTLTVPPEQNSSARAWRALPRLLRGGGSSSPPTSS